MKTFRIGFLAAFVLIAGLFAAATPGGASAFFAWSVTDVPAGDTLNIRAWPSSQSQILVAYPNNTTLSLTGKCTGGVTLDAIAGLAKWKQRQAVRYQWCQVWIDPNGGGQYRAAWVYGKYIRPA